MSDTATQSRGGDFATSRRGGLTTYEIDFIRDQRAKGRSVQTIAKMLGRSQADIAPETNNDTLPGLVAVERKAPPKAPEAAWEVISAVAKRYGLLPEDLIGRGLRTAIICARQEAWHRLREMRTAEESYRFTLPQIASWFDRDHSTVLSGISSHQRRAEHQASDDLVRWQQLGKVA